MTESKNSLTGRLLALGIGLAAAVSGGYLVAPSEGEINSPYLDPVGIKTVCMGHTGRDIENREYSHDECVQILAEDLDRHNRQMLGYIRVPITVQQNAALLSFCFNVGVSACSRSTAFKKLNAMDYSGACAELKRWVYAGGRKMPGLITRRANEYAMCMGQMANWWVSS